MDKEKNSRLKIKEIFVIVLSVFISATVIVGVVKVIAFFHDIANVLPSGGVTYTDDKTGVSGDDMSIDIDSYDETDYSSEDATTNEDEISATDTTKKMEDDSSSGTTENPDEYLDVDGKLYSRTGIKKAGASPSHSAPYTVIIDPGHGFADVGCINDLLRGKTEKEITMEMALLLCDELEKRGFKVILIHDGKTFPSVSELTALANHYNVYYKAEHFVDNNVFSAYERSIYANVIAAQQTVDFYISLHVNSVETEIEKRSGFEIDYCVDNDYSEASGKIFEYIIEKLYDAFPDTKMNSFRDSWEDSFIVTKFPIMPSILFEMGFATNETDAANFFDSEFRAKLVNALADGISQYFE